MRIYLKNLICLFVLIAFTAACQLEKPKTQRPVKQKAVYYPAKPLIETSSVPALKSNKKIVVPAFRLAFASEYFLDMKPESYQAIANTAYKNFTADLKAAGFDVITDAKLKSSETYRSIEKSENGLAIEADGKKVKYYSPTALPLITMPGENNKSASITDITADPKNTKMVELMKQLDASVVIVTLFLDFSAPVDAIIDQSGKDADKSPTIIVKNGSDLKIISRKNLECTGFCPNYAGSVTLSQNVYSTAKLYDSKKHIDDKAIESAAKSVVKGVTLQMIQKWKAAK